MNYSEIWDFIHDTEQVKFPDQIYADNTLIAEFIPDGNFSIQYRLYVDKNGNKKYAKVSLK